MEDWENVLGKGQKNAIQTEELMERLGFRSVRGLRAAIQRARLAGVPICSIVSDKKKGYFLADLERPGEIDHYINEMKKRAFTSLKQVKIMSKWRENALDDQMTIGEFLRDGGRK